ncbi:hypothetical protein SUGI_0336880 [Cryptomeria japonica]|nr:hypothetical protein SUGI_0336880 [Cryptomeria japonica]
MALFALSLRFAAQSPNTHLFVIRQYAKLSMAVQNELQGIDMNVELSAFCREGELKEALTLLQFMEKNRIPIKSYAYDCLLQTCARAKSLPQGGLRKIKAFTIIKDSKILSGL